MAIVERKLIAEIRRRKVKRKEEKWTGEESISGRGRHFTISGQCPCYGQVYSTGARTVSYNILATF